MTTTSNMAPQQRPFSLEQISEEIRGGRTCYGAFVSQQVWDELKRRVPQAFDAVGFAGLRFAIDPQMPPNQCDFAFTKGAWERRLSDIEGRHA